ncbi:20574_t:CDS:2, partial [Gigaspora rosea]
DQQKAFDRVNHRYLRMVLNKMNFDKKYVNIVNALFLSQQAYIMDSGLLSELFRVERDVCQEDPLSPLLYILAIELLLKHIYKKIYGIEIKNQCFNIMAYADDLTIGIGFQSDWLDLLEIIKTYEAASNARVKVTILGYKVDSNGNPIKHLWEDLARKIQNKINTMANRNLSLK